MIDVKQALLNPSGVFHKPQDVVKNRDLTVQQKIEILRRWEYDARELQVAEEEGMRLPPGSLPVNLDTILKALRLLGAGADVERSAPTKQGGS